MNAKQVRRAFAAVATAAALGLGASAANAFVANFDHDSIDLVNVRASYVLAGLDWGVNFSTDSSNGNIVGKTTGTLTYHGGVAGCAQIKIFWRNANRAVIGTDTGPLVCSNSSAPSAPSTFTRSFSSKALSNARVEMHLREFNGATSQVAYVVRYAGDN